MLSESEGPSQGYPRRSPRHPNDLLHQILRINATCIERRQHGRLDQGGKQMRGECEHCEAEPWACRANGLQHCSTVQPRDGVTMASRAEQQIFMSLVLIKQIRVYEGLSLCTNKPTDLI